ncbi:MAG: hypothetical protein M3R00_07455 [Pseudomonadota bacterium]|nr:hypothetical protein [Pseudomonadota bacterium]
MRKVTRTPTLSDAAYYETQLLAPRPKAEALAKFCTEDRSAAFIFLDHTYKFELLIELIHHSEKGKKLVCDYLAVSSQLDWYNCDNLEKYVSERFESLVTLYSIVIALERKRQVLLKKACAEQQLQDIITKYCFSETKYFDAYSNNKVFYLYFQKENIPLDKLDALYCPLCPRNIKGRPWILKHLGHRFAVEVLLIQGYTDFIAEAFYYYDELKKSLDKKTALAATIYTRARLNMLYDDLQDLMCDDRISPAFKKDLYAQLMVKFMNNAFLNDDDVLNELLVGFAKALDMPLTRLNWVAQYDALSTLASAGEERVINNLEYCNMVIVKHICSKINRELQLSTILNIANGVVALEEFIDILASHPQRNTHYAESYKAAIRYLESYYTYYCERLVAQALMEESYVPFKSLKSLSNRRVEAMVACGNYYETLARKALVDYNASYLSFFSGSYQVIDNAKEAFGYYERARIAGSAEASYRCGVINEEGLGRDVDMESAMDYFRIAASKKHELAMNKLPYSEKPIVANPKSAAENKM